MIVKSLMLNLEWALCPCFRGCNVSLLLSGNRLSHNDSDVAISISMNHNTMGSLIANHIFKIKSYLDIVIKIKNIKQNRRVSCHFPCFFNC